VSTGRGGHVHLHVNMYMYILHNHLHSTLQIKKENREERQTDHTIQNLQQPQWLSRILILVNSLLSGLEK